MNPLLKKYLKAVVKNLLVAAIVALIARVLFHANEWGIFLLWGIVAVTINTVGLVITHFTIKSLEEQLEMPYLHLYEAYVVHKIHRQIPMEQWTQPIVYYYLTLYRTTGGKPLL